MDRAERYTVEFCVMQAALNEYVARHGRIINYPEMTYFLYKDGKLCAASPRPDRTILQQLDEESFLHNLRHRRLPMVIPNDTEEVIIQEGDAFPSAYDCFVLQHFYNISSEMHVHDYFEVVYVYRGTCEMHFENEERILREGEICIIAPGSKHGLRLPTISDITLMIWIRKSTFNHTFFALLSQKDLLSYFFQAVLYGRGSANYLLFYTHNTPDIKNFVKSMFYNCMLEDNFSNTCLNSLVSLFFATLLRNYSQTIEFYNYTGSSEFSLILQYIQHNYKHLTLRNLAEIFHYSEAHLSALIKKNTGHNFVDLIAQLKLSYAAELLKNTTLKIAEISEMSGYNSSDHFSRVFRQNFHVSPSQYRKMQHENS